MQSDSNNTPTEQVTDYRESGFPFLDQAGNPFLIRRFIKAGLAVAVLVPVIFWLRFGSVGWFGWSVTAFLVVMSELFALGLYFGAKPKFHTPVAEKADRWDKLGRYWLVACAGGPFFGWIATNAFAPTDRTWRWQFGLRILLAVVAPIVTALPLTRYARGRSALIAVPLLVLVTALPLATAYWTVRDLILGPVVSRAELIRQQGSFAWTC
ncbi:MAG: hypothetical protein ABIP75_13505, partial [Pyrinomonadaceae bacterium]